MAYKDLEKQKQSRREYNEKNKERIKQKKKEYRENNKTKIAENNKEYRQTPNGKKSTTINNWKKYGLIHDNYDELYDKYLDTSECDVCKYVFDETNKRCMDHDHTTNLFRQFLCNKCNVNDNWKMLV